MLAQGWMNDLGARPDMSIKVGFSSCDMRIAIFKTVVSDVARQFLFPCLYFSLKSVRIELTRNIEMEQNEYEFIIIRKYYKSIYREGVT